MNKSLQEQNVRIGETMFHDENTKEIVRRYQKFKDHAFLLTDLAKDLYMNRHDDELIRKVWEKKEVQVFLREIHEMKEIPYPASETSLELYYVLISINNFYETVRSTIMTEESIQNSKVLFQILFNFRVKCLNQIDERISEFAKSIKPPIGFEKDVKRNEELIMECLTLHAVTQCLKLENTMNEFGLSTDDPEIECRVAYSLDPYDGEGDEMERMWIGRIQKMNLGFKNFPLPEFRKELLTYNEVSTNHLMLDFAKEFYSVGLHNVIMDAISTFVNWTQEEFEQAWKDDWGYDFEDLDTPRIEKKRNAKRIDLRKEILRYDPLLEIAIKDILDKGLKNKKEITKDSVTQEKFYRLYEFVEVQLMLTKIVHLSSRARFWKSISKELEKRIGKRFLSGHLFTLDNDKSKSEREELLLESATNELPGKGWELHRLSTWFLENARNTHSKLHLLMLEANLYEGTIHGIEWNEEKETSESDWGEKIVIELMPFKHEEVGEISASYLYLTTENKAAGLTKRQDIAYQYTMDKNSSTINREMKDSEFNSLIYERLTGMTDLNTKYGELLKEKNKPGLKKLAQKIVERFSEDVTLQHGFKKSSNGASPTNFHCKNINKLPEMHLDLDEILLTQEIKNGNKKYWAVHSDEWGDNFLIGGKGIGPIDFEDVIFTEKSNAWKNEPITYQTGGGTLSSRFVNAEIIPQGFEFRGLAPVNLLSSLARLVASLIQFQIRVKDGQTSEEERKYHEKFLDIMHQEVKEVLLKKAKTQSQENILTCQYNLSIIDWLAHWHLKSNQKMPEEDFNTLRNYIVEEFLPEYFQGFDISPRKNVSIRGFELDFGGISHVSSSDKDDDDDESDGGLPNCPNCGDSNNVKGPDDDGDYWCEFSDCDVEYFFS